MGVLLMFCGFIAIHASEGSVQSVVLVTLDGLRTQELFGGLDMEVLKSSLKKDAKVEDTVSYARYWASTPEERRLRLMPFFWGTLMKQFGFVYGNAALGSRVKVSKVGAMALDMLPAAKISISVKSRVRRAIFAASTAMTGAPTTTPSA